MLLGQNGTGKTTLLQWMADFMSGDLESWSREPYRVEVEMEAGVEPDRASLRLLVDNEISELPRKLEAQHGIDKLLPLMNESPRTSLHTRKLTIAFIDQVYEILERPNHLSLYVNDAPLLAWESPHGAYLVANLFTGTLSRAVDALATSTDAATEAARNQALEHFLNLMSATRGYPPASYRFDESLEFFHRIVAGPRSETQVEWYPPLISNYHLIPVVLLLLMVSKLQRTEADIQTLAFSSEDVQGFLATAVQLFQHRSASLHLDLLAKNVLGGQPVSRYGNLRFTFQRHDGSIIGHDALSYGQKRMLSFLYYLALHPRFIIVDELVNGLHHAWIEACIDQIGDRQGILTSQNPILLDHMSFDSADEVRQRFILCRSERQADGRDLLIWRDPTQEEAESFFRAYRAGIQHIGEILVDKGLW